MNAEIVIELIRLIPTLLWIGLILVAVWLLHAQLRSRLSAQRVEGRHVRG